MVLFIFGTEPIDISASPSVFTCYWLHSKKNSDQQMSKILLLWKVGLNANVKLHFFYYSGYFLGASGKPLNLWALKVLPPPFALAVNNDRSLTSQFFLKLFRAIPFEILGGWIKKSSPNYHHTDTVADSNSWVRLDYRQCSVVRK